MTLRRLVLTMAVALLPGWASLQGQEPESVPEPAPLLDRAELEGFLDGLMAAHLADHQVRGATLAIVHEGELLLSKGYGFTDAEGRVPVDPATTLFRIGSVTKTFTWTAVLQLRDRGLLDLDEDVNIYLDFRIPDTYDEAITLRHLMTHTPGFEDRVFGLFGEESGLPRGTWMAERLPARVRPPGTLPAYSNYGAALAGYIVERVSGMPWEDYVEAEILAPLGMTQATPREPLPEALAPHMSGGFRYRDGRFEARPFERIGAAAPAGSMSASAEAMAAYMIAHLEAAAGTQGGILPPASAREMQDRAFGLHPRVNGLGLGFYEMSGNEVRIVGHGGGTQWFFTDMALFPEERLGVFVSYNSEGGAVLPVDRFMRAFLGRFFPAEPPDSAVAAEEWAERAASYEGRYRMLRRPYTTFEKLLGLAMGFQVRAGDGGEITISSPMFPALPMREVEPGYFRDPDGFRDAAFVRDERTGRDLLLLGALPPVPAERGGVLDAPGLHLSLLVFWLGAFLSVLILMPARYLLQRRFLEIDPLSGWERGLRWIALLVVLLSLAFLGGMSAIGDQEAFLAGTPLEAIRVALIFPVLAVLPAVALVVGALHAWREGCWGFWARVHFTLVAVAAVVFLAQLHYWNLLGWKM